MHLDIESAGACIRLLLGILGILLAWQYMLKPMYLDTFRQRVFALRRDLFLMMASGHIARTDPAYKHLRRTMSSVLRFAERLTAARLVINRFMFREMAIHFDQQINRKLNLVQDDAVRERLRDLDRQLGEAIHEYCAATSPLVWRFLRLTKRCLRWWRTYRMNTGSPPPPIGIIRAIEVEAEVSAKASGYTPNGMALAQ